MWKKVGAIVSRTKKTDRDRRRKGSLLHHKTSRDARATPKSSRTSPTSVVPEHDSTATSVKGPAIEANDLLNFGRDSPPGKKFPDRPEAPRRVPERLLEEEVSESDLITSPLSSTNPTSRELASDDPYGLSKNWMLDYSLIKIGKTIGHSSFGTVNEGILNGTKVAVKTIKRNPRARLNEDIEAFKKESELNCKLRHPNIVLFMGICVEPRHVCIVTELMARGNVRDLLVGPINGRSVKLDWSVRLQWALDTATGMTYLHSLHPPMIHRDLKTTNLLVDKGMNVKICDFGLSRFQAEDKVMSAVGTVQFAAPEVLKHEKYTEKADVFSFGTVLWELQTRAIVFKGLPQIEVYRAVIEGQMPDVPHHCNPRYRQLMKDCWKVDPSKRPSFREAIEILSEIQESFER